MAGGLLLLAGLATGAAIPRITLALALALAGAGLVPLCRRHGLLPLAAGSASLAAACLLPLAAETRPLAVCRAPAILVAVASVVVLVLLPAGSPLAVRKGRRAEGMPAPGVAGTVIVPLRPESEGRVVIAGERFRAVSRHALEIGAPILVAGRRRGALLVEASVDDRRVTSEHGVAETEEEPS